MPQTHWVYRIHCDDAVVFNTNGGAVWHLPWHDSLERYRHPQAVWAERVRFDLPWTWDDVAPWYVQTDDLSCRTLCVYHE